MNVFQLTKEWFSFFRENLDRVNSNHTAMYFYIIELFNQNDWIPVLGLPTDYTMASLNIRSYKTYKKILNDLVDFGKLEMIEKSKNQFTSNKIALVKNTKASTKANTKRLKSDDQSDYKSDCTISKLLNKETIKLLNNNTELVNDNLKEWIESNKQDKNNDKTFSSEVSECYDSVVDLFPEKTQPETESNICKWKDEIRKIIEIDKYSVEDVKRLCKAARNDSFWSNNFLSIMKLRNKNKDGIKYIDVFNEKFKKRSNYGYSPQDSIWQG